MAKNEPKQAKKRKRGVMRGMGRTLMDLPTWFSLEYFRSANRSILDLVKGSFTFSGKKEQSEADFELAMQRQGVTEADLAERVVAFKRNTIIMSSFGGIVAIYTLYLLFSGVFVGFLIGAVVAGLSFVKAFQYSLWGFQIKQRKLGCTFQEWREAMLGSINKPRS